MTRSFDGLRPLLLAPALLLAALGCASEDGDPKGAPVIEAFDALDVHGMPVMPGQPVSPRLHFSLRFDRLLDGALLEDVMGTMVVGKPGVAQITAAPPVGVATVYVPNGGRKSGLVFPPGPQLHVMPVPTLPSGAAVTVTIDRSKLQARGAGPAVNAPGVPDMLAFTTLPFAATIGPRPDGAPPPAPALLPLPAGQPITVAFSNLPEEMAARHLSAVVTDTAGAAVPGAALPAMPNMMDPAVLEIAPAGGAWPVGATVRVSVDAACKDALGAPLTTAAGATFEVQP